MKALPEEGWRSEASAGGRGVLTVPWTDLLSFFPQSNNTSNWENENKTSARHERGPDPFEIPRKLKESFYVVHQMA